MLRWWVEPPRVHFLAFAWALTILLLSATPGRDLPNLAFEHLDKIVHANAYGILAILLCFSFRALGIKSLFVTFVIATSYGFLMELMQGTFFVGRYFDTADGIANGIGSLIGIVIFKRLDRTF